MVDQDKIVKTVVTTETTTEYDRDLNLFTNVLLLTVIGLSLVYIFPKKPNKET